MKRNVCGVLRRKLCRTPISPFISANITLRSMHYPSAAQRRLAFQQFLNRESAPFVGHDVSGEGAGEAINHCHTEVEDRKVEHNVRRRHVLDLVEVRPLQGKLEEGEEFNENERWETRPGNATREGSQPHKGRRNDQYTRRGCDIDPQQRGARDLLSLQQRAAHAVRNAKNKKLVEECRRAAMTLREIHAALQGSTTVANANACSGNNGSAVPCTGGTTEGRIVPSEAVRFQRLHQLRDTTYHLTAEHFAQFPQGFVLDFLDTIGRIVSLVGDPNMTGHGHVVRQAVRSLFMRRYAQSYPDFTSKPPGRKSRSPGSSAQAQCETLLPIHYFRLLRSTLSLPPADSLKIRGPLGTAVPVEEFCVRQLYTANNNGACSSASSAAYSLQQLGPARAVRVVSWCMRCGLSSSHPTAQGSTWISSSSTLPPVSDLRIPFGVGKEYTHALLGCLLSPTLKTATKASRRSYCLSA
uniref:WGS project CAEQ00000000 data, annotated contig 1759 n=1 Tax=Trypanosoma congolense (strain IL3000) TaxID=1068625 RepID=F9W8Q3_TRYCI|nr:unnamed protein product [Trypanosoma congolense IL3000]